MEECNYCNDKEPIWDGTIWKVKISAKNKELEVECNSETFEYLNIDLKYCPFCGRKL